MRGLGTFTITSDESVDFAQASGDFNPLHIDPVSARRTRFGQTVIHGVCGTLKAIDLFLQDSSASSVLKNIKVKYSRPVSQGMKVTVIESTTDGRTRLELLTDEARCQVIDIEMESGPTDLQSNSVLLGRCYEGETTCHELNIDDCNGLSDAVDLRWDSELMLSLFPSATRLLPQAQLSSIMASTEIVGMRCPGMHSVFAQLNLRFFNEKSTASAGSSTQMQYSVTSADKRIDRIEIQVNNAYTEGTVEAFFRAPPVQQASFRKIESLVSPTEFRTQNALIVGASRGLGEVITKVLAAGGATTMMTFAAGRKDAERVANEISLTRTAPSLAQYDVLESPLDDELAEFFASVTHIYYLASPAITKNDSKKWNRQLFAQYCDFYVDGLAKLLEQVQHSSQGIRKIHLFIPSSVFLEQSIKGFDEYIAAKAAAESYVRCFGAVHSNWKAVAPRLPRLHTDQTSSIKNIDEEYTLRVIIEQLRLAFGEH